MAILNDSDPETAKIFVVDGAKKRILIYKLSDGIFLGSIENKSFKQACDIAVFSPDGPENPVLFVVDEEARCVFEIDAISGTDTYKYTGTGAVDFIRPMSIDILTSKKQLFVCDVWNIFIFNIEGRQFVEELHVGPKLSMTNNLLCDISIYGNYCAVSDIKSHVIYVVDVLKKELRKTIQPGK